jgi:hypothetical protein
VEAQFSTVALAKGWEADEEQRETAWFQERRLTVFLAISAPGE